MDRERGAAGRIAWLCAAFMLVALPLLFHDKLFDINRFKVAAVCAVAPALCAAAALALLLRRGAPPEGKAVRPLRAPLLCVLVFAAAVTLSCAAAGFERAVLFGDEGRYGGLFFVLSCALSFFLVALLLPRGDALPVAASAAAALVAALGALNLAGIDPLGFYDGIEPGQETVFLSTIGHFDFFGTYLAVLLGLSGGQFVFGKRPATAALCGVSACAIALGAACARTESAFAGTQLACFALLALSGDGLAQMARALMLWGVAFLALPAARALASLSPYAPVFSGLSGLLAQSHAVPLLGALLLAASALCLAAKRRGARAPGRRRTLRLCAALFAAGAALLLGAIVYFTAFDGRALGALEDALRFGDRWGSGRGAVYVRVLRAYADFGPKEKLLGGGLELARRILDPYFDDPALLVFGYYNDAHCQILQLLITCGPVAAAAFAGVYLASGRALLRGAGDDPVALGALAALAAYLPVALFNVTQPILVATFFSVCALGLSRLRAAP